MEAELWWKFGFVFAFLPRSLPFFLDSTTLIQLTSPSSLGLSRRLCSCTQECLSSNFEITLVSSHLTEFQLLSTFHFVTCRLSLSLPRHARRRCFGHSAVMFVFHVLRNFPFLPLPLLPFYVFAASLVNMSERVSRGSQDLINLEQDEFDPLGDDDHQHVSSRYVSTLSLFPPPFA